MRCKDFRSCIPLFLDDSIPEEALHSIWEHGLVCERCTFSLMHQALKKLQPSLANPQRLAATMKFIASTTEQKKYTYKDILKVSRHLRWNTVYLLIQCWRKECCRIDDLQQYILAFFALFAEPDPPQEEPTARF